MMRAKSYEEYFKDHQRYGDLNEETYISIADQAFGWYQEWKQIGERNLEIWEATVKTHDVPDDETVDAVKVYFEIGKGIVFLRVGSGYETVTCDRATLGNYLYMEDIDYPVNKTFYVKWILFERYKFFTHDPSPLRVWISDHPIIEKELLYKLWELPKWESVTFPSPFELLALQEAE